MGTTPRLVFMGDAGPDWGVDGSFPPTLVLHGTGDTIVPIDHSRRFAERVKSDGGHCELVEYDGMPHAFYKFPAPKGCLRETLGEMERFLRSLRLL